MRYYQQNEKKCKTSSTLIESFVVCVIMKYVQRALQFFFLAKNNASFIRNKM